MDAVGQLAAALAGRYTVDREIGRGGMATVYLARDVRHNRKVALKVLNPELGAVLGVERFLAEIQVTANLQHPNLLPLFDSGEANGLLFYVMPFIEGESLRAMLNREKQLPIEDAVRVATSIAAALDYAHRRGVIHRDLKPENILMHDGQPLVADFGIALAVSNAGGDRITQTGLSLGTPQYMSPEQATGDREVDGRTDLYSLGALTYEMLAGEPPHDGKTSQAIIAKILTDKPRSLRLSRDTVPPHIEGAVLRALAKLPADRFHTAHEFADALQGKSLTAVHEVSARPQAPGPRPTWITVTPWLVATLALVAAAVAWQGAGRSEGEARTLRYEISLPPNVNVTRGRMATVAIAPAGRLVAYVATRDDGSSRILVRADDDLEPRQIPGTEGAISVTFSPEGSQLAFIANGDLRKVPVSGGKVETIVESLGNLARGFTWSSSGWIIVSNGIRLVKLPAVGGPDTAFTQPLSASGETSQINPVALPDGKSILYTSLAMGGAANSRIGIATLDGTSTILDVKGAYPLGVVDGFLVYTTAVGTLMAVPFDVQAQRVTGASQTLADQAAMSTAYGVGFAAMAVDGSIAYVTGAVRRQAVLVNPDGSTNALGEPGQYRWPRFSPDGRRIALSSGPLSQADVYLLDRPAATPTRVTFGPESNDRPEWKADGSAIVYRSTQGERRAIWSIPSSGGSPTALFGRSDSQIDEGVLSPDGRYLVVQRDSTGNGETWVASLDGSNELRQVRQVAGVYGARFSPDGKWIVLTGNQTGGEEVYVTPLSGLGNLTQVSFTGGGTPVWSADGRKIYYVNGEQLIAATIGSTTPFTIASRQVVLARGHSFLGVHADYDVARDGTILAFQSPSGSIQLVVVRNIGAELKARVRAAPR